MKPLINALKSLISEHSIDILQQEQRLKAMLADLLPHDKQMRFLLELSLRAQIPQKLIAQQNETRLGWEAQIKSMKHYFKDEYFLEDKAVESVFDCWVEVLPRNSQKPVAPKLGRLYAKSKIKNIDPITWHNWHKFAFKQNSNWQPFFEESNITNYQSFFKDIGIIKNSNNTGSYPKLLLPISLLNEVNKQPPLELPEKLMYFEKRFQHTKEDFEIVNTLSNQKRYKELNDYAEKRGINEFNRKQKREKEVYEKREQERKSIQINNDDNSQTFSLDYFRKNGSLLGFDLSIPETPVRPRVPQKKKLPEEKILNNKELTRKEYLGFGVTSIVGALCLVLFIHLASIGGPVYRLSFLPLLVIILIGFFCDFIIIAFIYQWIKKWFNRNKTNEAIKLKELNNANQLTEYELEYQEELSNYNNVLMPQYNNDFYAYEKKREKQIKDLNENFPLIARQMWLKAIYTNCINISTGKPIDTSIAVQKLVAQLELLYPKNIKVGLKFPNFLRTAILLHFNNRVIINIEVDEPYDRETRKETNFIGSADEGRDMICAENNMFVLRFSKSQVTYALSECVSIVQELVLFTQSTNTQHLLNIRDVSKSIEVLCWTKEEAKLMAMNEE